MTYWHTKDYVMVRDSQDIVQQLHYRPNFRSPVIAIDLGNNGSATRDLFFKPDSRSGLLLGYNAMDAYRWSFLNLPYFSSNNAYTHLLASQGTSFANSTASSQDNSHFEATFYNQFANDVHASVFYRKLSETGLLNRDASNHTQFAVRIDQGDIKSTIHSFSFIRNAFNRHENGGITNIDVYEDPNYDIRTTIPIILSDAGTRDEENRFSYANKLMLTGRSGRGLYFESVTSFVDRSIKYFDNESTTTDPDYQKWVNNDAGSRSYVSHQSFGTDIGIKWESDYIPEIKVGLGYDYNDVDNENQQLGLHYAQLKGGLQTNIRGIFSLNLQSQVELLEEVGDFDLQGDIGLTWKGVGQLKGRIALGTQSPSFNQKQIVINQETMESFDLRPYQYLSIGGDLTIPYLGLKLSADQRIMNDYVFMNEELVFLNADEVLSVTQFTLEADHSWASIHFRNILLTQFTQTDILPLPTWYSRHFLYFDGKVFKGKMSLRTGVEARVIHQDNIPKYIPIVNQFIPFQQEQQWAYMLDPFVEARIDRFVIFIKTENIESTWLARPYLNAVGYPVNDWILRFGINWRYSN